MAGFIKDTLEKQNLDTVNKSAEENTKTRDALSALIKSGQFKHTYFIYGDEGYLVRYYKNALIKAITGDNELNVSCFEGADFDREEFLEIACTLPFFAEKRVVVLEYSGLFKVKKRKEEENQEPGEEPEFEDAFLPDDFFDDIPDSTCIIITDKKIAKNIKIVKNLLKDGEAFELKYQDVPFINTWLTQKFRKSGKVAEPGAINALINQIGVDMNTLNSEADKLISFSNEGVIKLSDIESVTSDRFENKVFKVVEYAVTGRMEQALSAYKDVLALNAEPIPILVLMGKQISKYLAASEIYSRTRNSSDVYNKLKIGYFNNVASYCNKEKLESALERYIDLDRSIKEGNLDMNLAPELLIAYLAR